MESLSVLPLLPDVIEIVHNKRRNKGPEFDRNIPYCACKFMVTKLKPASKNWAFKILRQQKQRIQREVCLKPGKTVQISQLKDQQDAVFF